MTLPLRLLIIFAVIKGLATAPAFGQDSTDNNVPPNPEKSFSVGAEVFGLSPYPVRSQGLRTGYFITDSHELEITYVRSQTSVLQADLKYSECSMNLNVFYDSEANWGLGLGVRDITLHYDLFVTDDDALHSFTDHEQAIVINGHFGFQFSYANRLTIGSDLITISSPIHWTKRSGSFPADVDEKEENPKEFPIAESGYRLNLQFLRTFIKVRI